MTEIENIEEAIKLLQSQLDLLKETEDRKSPEEKAYKRWWGDYPPTEPSKIGFEDNMWSAFQKGYKAAKEDLEPKPEGSLKFQSVDAEPLEEVWNQSFRSIQRYNKWLKVIRDE